MDKPSKDRDLEQVEPRRPAPEELTEFLNALGRGRAELGETLMPYVYDELRAIAAANLGRGLAGRLQQPTELINEVFLRLFRPERVEWNDRKHFFALAAKAMRQLLVDQARRRARLKRGGDQRSVNLDENLSVASEDQVDMLDLDQALQELCSRDARQGRVVELRYFGGLDFGDVADVLEVSKSTVEREWRSAKAWLGHRLHQGN